MSKHHLEPPLTPRRGKTLQVMGIARFSGGPRQTDKSNEDQEALLRNWLSNHMDIPFALNLIAGKGSGECLEREEAERAQEELESGRYDLVLAEDLGRIFRRVHAYLFCESAEDV